MNINTRIFNATHLTSAYCYFSEAYTLW